MKNQQFVGRAKVVPARGSILLPYQAKWTRDESRLKIAEKARQIGWTWATAGGLVMRKGRKGADCDAWVASRDELQAQLFLEDCTRFADVYSLAWKASETGLIVPKGATDHVLRFSNGRRIHSLSSNPDAQAGKRGDRILDEFALHEDPRKLYGIALPGITWGGSVEIFSTHRGTRNFFNELLNEIKHQGNPKGFSLHRVTLQDALEQGFLYKLQSKLPEGDARQGMDEAAYFDFVRRGCADEESFQEEFCCQPCDDNAAFLSYDLIASCEYRAEEDWEMDFSRDGSPSRRGGRLSQADQPSLYIGVDVGRDHDLTVIWVVEKLGDVYFTRAVDCLDRESFDAQEGTLYAWLRNAAVKRCCIDRTGIGRQFVERAMQKFGTYRVEGVHFSGPVKEELAYPVRAAFEDRTIRIPNEKAIRADLRSIRKETTASGNIRFTGERTQNGHADRFWALALALHAAKEANAPQYWAQVI
jgi:phage FluMu gp28-like protein